MDRKHRRRPAAVFCRNLSQPNIHLSSSRPSSSPRISDKGLKQRPTCHEIRCKLEGKLRRNSTVCGQDATRETFPQFFCEGTRDLPGRFQASLSKKASDVRSIPGSRASTNSRPWHSGSLASQRWPCSLIGSHISGPYSTYKQQ
ncbi:hypothetical protein COP2_010690 [Malus domestica]